MPNFIPRLSVLISYAFVRDGTIPADLFNALGQVATLLVDCGAVTVHKAGLSRARRGTDVPPIPVEEYIQFCQRIHGAVWQYFALDVIRSPSLTRRNLEAMCAAGLRPMPIFVEGESFASMRELADINPHIGLAGGRANVHYMHARFRAAYAASDERARLHGLAFVRHPDLFHLPIATADSSTWCTGGMFGSVMRYLPETGLLTRPWTWILAGKPSLDEAMRFTSYLRKCNVPASWIANPAAYRGSASIAAFTTTNAYLSYQAHLASLGKGLFLAISTPWWLFALVSVAATRTATGTFDYLRSRAIYTDLCATWKRDRKRATAQCLSIIRDTTDWRTPVLQP